jgi:hypothetical protein
MLERFSTNGHFDIVDINPELSDDGVLKSEYTSDGIHFNGRAYDICTDKLVRVAGLSARSASREDRGQRYQRDHEGHSGEGRRQLDPAAIRIVPARRQERWAALLASRSPGLPMTSSPLASCHADSLGPK